MNKVCPNRAVTKQYHYVKQLELLRCFKSRGRNPVTVSKNTVVQNYSSVGFRAGTLFRRSDGNSCSNRQVEVDMIEKNPDSSERGLANGFVLGMCFWALLISLWASL